MDLGREVLFGGLEEYGTIVYAVKGKLYYVDDAETHVFEDTPENREKYVKEAMDRVKEWLM